MTYGPSCARFMSEKKHRTDDHLWRREARNLWQTGMRILRNTKVL